MAVCSFVVQLVILTSTISATVVSQNVTRSYHFSPIPVSTKLIARTKIPRFMNSRGSYTVTKILDDTGDASMESIQSSTPMNLVTFPSLHKPYNHSKTTSKYSKGNKISKSLKSSPIILVSTMPTTNLVTTTKATTKMTKLTTTTNVNDAGKNKLSMSKLAIMAATLTADGTTPIPKPNQNKTTVKPKQKKDKTKNPKNKLAKHKSTTPKPKNSKYTLKKKTTRKTKTNKNRKQKKVSKRKAKAQKNNKRHTRKHRQADGYVPICHATLNPKQLCTNETKSRSADKLKSTDKPTLTDKPMSTDKPKKVKKITKRRVAPKYSFARRALKTIKKLNGMFPLIPL